MIKIRKSNDRGHANYGWLDTNYTFSFNNYYDRNFMGFRDLRVINEDFIEPKRGFPKHGHTDMEIITYVISGELSHEDSMGNGTTILPHEVQRMSAGTGIMHSEYSSETDKTHLLQIWILPETEGLVPSYEQIYFAPETKKGKLKLVASHDAREGSVKIHQDVSLYASLLEQNESVDFDLAENRHAWFQIVKGSIDLNGEILTAGDGAAVSEENSLKIQASENGTEFLLFDLK